MSAFSDLLLERPVDELVPGDPAATARAGAALRPVSDRWNDAGADLAAVRPDWEGVAGDAFRTRQRLDADGWQNAAECLGRARVALLDFSDTLSAAKATAGTAIQHFEDGPIALAVVKRSLADDAALTVAGQPVAVDGPPQEA